MRRPRILHLEDDRDFSVLLARALEKAGLDLDLVTVDRPDAFQAALEHGGIDLVLSDRTVPQYSGLDALHDVKRRNLEIPFVILSGSSDGAEPYLAAGATECLIKDDLALVAKTLRRHLSPAGAGVRAKRSRTQDAAAATLAWAVTRLSQAVSVEEIVSVVPQAARMMCGAEGATIAFRDGDVCRQVGQDGVAPRSDLVLPIGYSVSGRAMRECRSVVIEDLAAQSPGPGVVVRGTAIGSALAAPVGRGFPVAAIAVYREQPHRPSKLEIQLLTALADMTALVLERTGLGAGYRIGARATASHPASPVSEPVARLLAHELRNPLWQIRGFAEHLRDDHAPTLGETGLSTVEHLLHASKELEGVIDGVAELAEISEASLSPRVVDVSAAVRDVAATILIADADRAVEWRVPDGLLAHADPALLRILLQKLLSNALRFTHGRAVALVEVGGDTSRKELTTFFIRDNGVGFNPADRSRLFVAFQRLHPADEWPGAGAGTGLAVVRRIVHRHGGEVWAEGAPDAGAVFHFSLPASR